jgi:hypothetical protein
MPLAFSLSSTPRFRLQLSFSANSFTQVLMRPAQNFAAAFPVIYWLPIVNRPWKLATSLSAILHHAALTVYGLPPTGVRRD